jgi:hypothetical protein
VGGEVSGRRTEKIRAENDGEVGDGHLVLVLIRVDPAWRTGSARLVGRCLHRRAFPAGRGRKAKKERRNALVEMAHEKLERSVVRVRKVVDALVKADVAKAVVLDLCKKEEET